MALWRKPLQFINVMLANRSPMSVADRGPGRMTYAKKKNPLQNTTCASRLSAQVITAKKRYSFPKIKVLDEKTALDRTFSSSDLQCLPPGDPIILCAYDGSPISGKSFIQRAHVSTRVQIVRVKTGPTFQVTRTERVTTRHSLFANATAGTDVRRRHESSRVNGISCLSMLVRLNKHVSRTKLADSKTHHQRKNQVYVQQRSLQRCEVCGS